MTHYLLRHCNVINLMKLQNISPTGGVHMIRLKVIRTYLSITDGMISLVRPTWWSIWVMSRWDLEACCCTNWFAMRFSSSSSSKYSSSLSSSSSWWILLDQFIVYARMKCWDAMKHYIGSFFHKKLEFLLRYETRVSSTIRHLNI
jgi:hypothetical protein